MAGQDYRRTITPGGISRINANGQTYIFCKTADRPIVVDIGGEKVVMRAGSYQEFSPLQGQNSQVVLYNTDPDNPAFVELVMGTGTYDEKIIRGNVSITPEVRRADGRFDDDTRYNIALSLAFDRTFTPMTYTRKQQVSAFVADGTDSPGVIERAQNDNFAIYESFDGGANQFYYGIWAPDTGERLGTLGIWRYAGGAGTVDYTVNGLAHFSGGKYLCYNSGGKKLTLRDSAGAELIGYTIEPPKSVACSDDKGYVLTLGGFGETKIEEWDIPKKTKIKTIDISALTGRDNWDRIDVVSGVAYVFDAVGGSFLKLDLEKEQILTLEQEAAWPFQDAIVVIGKRMYTSIYNGISGKTEVSWIAEQPFSLTAAGAASVGEGGSSTLRIFEPNRLDFKTEAEITVTYDAAGAVITGEVIRTALEFYFQKPVAENYLDHVFMIEAVNTGPVGEVPPKTITKSAGKTFKALEIADNFTIRTPGYVVLTLDAGLTFEE